jgi:hypothetical protein
MEINNTMDDEIRERKTFAGDIERQLGDNPTPESIRSLASRYIQRNTGYQPSEDELRKLTKGVSTSLQLGEAILDFSRRVDAEKQARNFYADVF